MSGLYRKTALASSNNPSRSFTINLVRTQQMQMQMLVRRIGFQTDRFLPSIALSIIFCANSHFWWQNLIFGDKTQLLVTKPNFWWQTYFLVAKPNFWWQNLTFGAKLIFWYFFSKIWWQNSFFGFQNLIYPRIYSIKSNQIKFCLFNKHTIGRKRAPMRVW